MASFLLRNSRLLDLELGILGDESDVLIVEGTIAEIGRALRKPATLDAEYDLRGLTLMPGLIDCHVHVVASHVNLALTARMPNALGVLRAVPILEGMLMRGFTTVRDAGGADWALAEASRTGLIKAPRILPSGKALSQTGGHGDFRERNDQLEACACSFRIAAISRVVDGVDEVRRAARDELAKGAAQIKVMASGGVVSPNDPIGSTGFSLEELRAIVGEADGWQTYVMAHAYTPKAIGRALEAGVRTIEHGNLIDASTAHLVKERGAFVVPTLITYEMLATEGPKLGLPPESVAKIDDVRRAGRTAIELLHGLGVRLGYGSDLLGDSHVHQTKELRLRAEIVGNLAALRSATTIAAEIIGRAGQLGVIRPGATADLLAVRGDPLRNLELLVGQGEQLAAIMKDGHFMKNQLT